MSFSADWRVADRESTAFKAGYLRADGVAKTRPDGESEALWFGLRSNMPLLTENSDFRAGYQRRVDELVSRWYVQSADGRGYWRRDETGTAWMGYTTNILEAGSWTHTERDCLTDRYKELNDPGRFINALDAPDDIQSADSFVVTLVWGPFMSIYSQNGYEVIGSTWHNSVLVDNETLTTFITEAALFTHVSERQHTLRTTLSAAYVKRRAM
jgi:hypothetical protein